MTFWWWIEPLAKTGILFVLFATLFTFIGCNTRKDIFFYIALICLIPIAVAFGGTIIWIFCRILNAIWAPYF